MSPIDPEGTRGQLTTRRRRNLRLRTLLIWLAIVPILAMSAQVAMTAQPLVHQSKQLRADVAVAERTDVPLTRLMVELQAARTMTATRWASGSVS